jgi:RimJ/RimL family protein N-acetyltransferase
VIEVRPIAADEIERYAALDGSATDDEFAGQLRQMLDHGTTRLGWCFVAVADGRFVARAAFATDEPGRTALERFMFGLTLDWRDPAAVSGAAELLARALPAIAAQPGAPIDARVNAELHDDTVDRRRLLSNAGFSLFQEKDGHVWRAGGPPPDASQRLAFRTLATVGRDAFVKILARGPQSTLDRNDRYFYELVGAEDWAATMMGNARPGDESTWKVAYDDDGRPVGYVMLSDFDEPATGTIVHLGVLPEMRGRGYVNDILAETTRDAIEGGLEHVLSDVDVLNKPMCAALERAGHRHGVRPWHVWHYRYAAA